MIKSLLWNVVSEEFTDAEEDEEDEDETEENCPTTEGESLLSGESVAALESNMLSPIKLAFLL